MKPSLIYMKGGMERGDTWIIGDDKSDWLYKGNNRSDFERFKNDFWIKNREDRMFFMLLVAIYNFVLAGAHYFLKGLWTVIFFKMGVFVSMIFLFYSIITFLVSLREYISYKKEYNSVYQRWIKIDSTRRRNYIGG